MNQRLTFSQVLTGHRPLPTFASLAIGAMLATLAVIAYAYVSTDNSVERARSTLQGCEVILLTWTAGLLASAFHLVSTKAEALLHRAVSLLPGTSPAI